jgi:hypothetical protein
MSVSRSAAPAVQFLLVANPGILLSSGQTRKLQQAIGGASSRLGALPGRRDRLTLLRDVFGDTGQPAASSGRGTGFNASGNSLLASLAGPGLNLQVQLRSAAEMNGAAVAYARSGPTGAPRLYLSAAVLESGISGEQITLLLLKGAGQHIDARLNGSRDAVGDEGLAFASRLSGRRLTAAEQTLLSREARGGVVSINGTAVGVETQASSSNPGAEPMAPNTAPSLSATTTAGSVREAEGLGSQAAPVTLFSNVTVSAGGSSDANQTITQLRLSVAGLRDGASERLWLDGTAISLGSNASGSTAGGLIPGGISYTLTLTAAADGSSTALLSLSSAAGLSSSAAAGLIQALAYQNGNSDNPTAGTRSITITGLSDSGGTANGGSDSATINITSTVTVIAVNDAPQLGSLSAISLTDTSAQDSFNASSGSLLASDPEGSSLSYGLEGATASSASFDGISYTLSKAGSYGTLYLNSSTGAYRFQPRSDWQLNALSSSGSESFNLSVTDGSLITSTALLVNFSGSSEAPEQYVLVDDGSPILNADAQALWEQALTNASRELSELLSDPNRDALLADVFARAGTDPAAFEANKQALLATIGGPGLQIEVDLRSNAELNGAAAAYAAIGHTGKERLYVNGDLINSGQLDLTLLTSALLEEYGHALDQRLNAGIDSPGDEGQLFASQVTGVTLTAEQRAVIDAENDNAVLTIEGMQVGVELDDINGISNLTFSNDTGINSTDLIVNSASQLMSASVSVNSKNDNAIKLWYSIGETGTRTEVTNFLSNTTNQGGSSIRTISLANAPITLSSNDSSIWFWTAATGANTIPFTTGNQSFQYKLDTTSPGSLDAITLDLADSSDSGISSTDNITNVTNPVITISSLSGIQMDAGDLIQIIDTSSSNAVVGSYTILNSDLTSGKWNRTTQDITLSSSLANGLHNLAVRLGDVAGNAGAASTSLLGVTIDTGPQFTSLTASAGNGASRASSIVITFNENIIANGGVVSLFTGTDKVFDATLTLGELSGNISYTGRGGITAGNSGTWYIVNNQIIFDTNGQGGSNLQYSSSFNGYISIATGALADSSGNTNQAITTANFTLNQSRDGTLPTLSAASWTTTSDNNLSANESVELNLAFNEIVYVKSSSAGINFANGGFARYLSGNGSTTLKFLYTVESSHSSVTDLIVSAKEALENPGQLRENTRVSASAD